MSDEELEDGQCPKCGALVDERFDCCEVHEMTEWVHDELFKQP